MTGSRTLLSGLFLLCGCTTILPSGPGAGILSVRPAAVAAGQCAAGRRTISNAIVYVPATAGARAPLLLFLHGAGRQPSPSIDRFSPLADENGIILVAPKSIGFTWDGIRGPLGPDVAAIDQTLAAVFAQCAIDASHLGVGGFSDGASYALTLGLANGELFSNVIAFSPCMLSDQIIFRGNPRVFLSHGRQDDILPIADCGRRLVSRLHQSRYRVRYEEFDGRHEVPPNIAAEAFRWFVDGAGPASGVRSQASGVREGERQVP